MEVTEIPLQQYFIKSLYASTTISNSGLIWENSIPGYKGVLELPRFLKCAWVMQRDRADVTSCANIQVAGSRHTITLQYCFVCGHYWAWVSWNHRKAWGLQSHGPSLWSPPFTERTMEHGTSLLGREIRSSWCGEPCVCQAALLARSQWKTCFHPGLHLDTEIRGCFAKFLKTCLCDLELHFLQENSLRKQVGSSMNFFLVLMSFGFALPIKRNCGINL